MLVGAGAGKLIFLAGTWVSQTRVPKTVQLTKLFHPHTILLIFCQKDAIQQILPIISISEFWKEKKIIRNT